MTTPSELFLEWLEKRPGDARVAVAIDSDRFLADAGMLDKSKVIDPAGREWHLVVFSGNDLEFRWRFRKATNNSRCVIVLTRGPYSVEPIDVSFVADILARNEAGEPLDLSVPAFFRRITPKINCPVTELRRFKSDLLARLDYAQDAAEKLIEKWGKPDSWGRGQVAAMVLLAYQPKLNLKDIWTDETKPAEFLAHAVRLLVGMPQLGSHREVVQQIIREAAREQVENLLFWAEAEEAELAGYLVLRDLAGQVKLQNPSNQLAGLQLFSPDLPLVEMDKLAPKVIAVLKDDGVWPAIGQRAEAFLTPTCAAKVLALLPPLTGNEKDTEFLLAQTTPAILRQQLLAALDGFFAKPSAPALAWVSALENHSLLGEVDVVTDRTRQCRAGLRLLLTLRGVEAKLAVPVPKFPHADALLDWYVQGGQHLLELDVSRAAHCLAQFDDDNLSQRGHQYLYGSDEQRPTPESLKGRVVGRLEELDRALSTFVRLDAEKFCRGARNVRSLLRAKIDVKQIAADTLPGKVWVLIFDGMRLDTWEQVVRPLLAEFFQIEDQPCFCLLPSYTEIARTGLLAGGTPSEWKGFKGTFNQDEAQLFAVNMGLTAQETKTKLRYVTGADTTKARKKLGFTDKDAPLLNVLIYPISDEEAHDFKDDLLIQSIGFNPSKFDRRVKMLMLLRLVPFVESNYNLIELGPRETGKTYTFRNTSNRAFVVSGGTSSTPSLFYNKASRKLGVIGLKHLVFFDEIAHTRFDDEASISMLKDYMQTGKFSRGDQEFSAPCSIVLGGNIDTNLDLKQPEEGYKHLFAVLPEELQDPAFLDRIHGYLPGWEMPKIRPENYAAGYGLLTDYMAEIFAELRRRNFQTHVNAWVDFGNMTGRNQDAIKKTAAGLLKLLHPHRTPDSLVAEEIQPLMEIAVEMRQRVTDQLAKILPTEFSNAQYVFKLAHLKA